MTRTVAIISPINANYKKKYKKQYKRFKHSRGTANNFWKSSMCQWDSTPLSSPRYKHFGAQIPTELFATWSLVLFGTDWWKLQTKTRWRVEALAAAVRWDISITTRKWSPDSKIIWHSRTHNFRVVSALVLTCAKIDCWGQSNLVNIRYT